MKKFIRSNRALTAFIIISLIVVGAGIAVGSELIYMLIGQYVILSVAGFICSACAVKKGKFLHPVIFILIASLLPFLIFKKTDIVFVIFSAIPCVAGFIIGSVAYLVSKIIKTPSDERKAVKEEKLLAIEEARNEAEDFSVGADDANSSEANAPEAEEVEEAEEATVEAEE